MAEPVDTRPWRKRHPILSRVVLFGIGGALVAALLLLWEARKEEDRLTRLRAELVSFDVVIGTPGGADAVLKKLDEDFADPGLPTDLRVDALRWRAMALRRNARTGDAEAAAEVEPTYERALALVEDGDTRYGLVLERVEGRLEVGEPESALALLDATTFPSSGPWALMAQHYRGLCEALTEGPEASAERIYAQLAALEAPLPTEPSVSAGGRTWNLPEVATVSTERLTKIYEELGRDPRPLWVRLSDLVADHAPSQVICAKMLMSLGDENSALTAWIRARRADPEGASAYADNDPVIGQLRRQADG